MQISAFTCSVQLGLEVLVIIAREEKKKALLTDHLTIQLYPLTMGISLEKCTFRQFTHFENITKHTYTHLDSVLTAH